MFNLIKPAIEAEYTIESDFTGKEIDPHEDGFITINLDVSDSKYYIRAIPFALHLSYEDLVQFMQVLKPKLTKKSQESYDAEMDKAINIGKQFASKAVDESDKSIIDLSIDLLNRLKA